MTNSGFLLETRSVSVLIMSCDVMSRDCAQCGWSVRCVCGWSTCRFMLELTTDQCDEYVNKIVSLANSAGCEVRHCLSVCLYWVAVQLFKLRLLLSKQWISSRPTEETSKPKFSFRGKFEEHLSRMRQHKTASRCLEAGSCPKDYITAYYIIQVISDRAIHGLIFTTGKVMVASWIE